MAVIGCLGDIVFEVSDATVRTLDNMVWSGSARYAVHQRHLTNALTFVPTDTETIVSSLVAMYEKFTGTTVQRASPERLFIQWVSNIIMQERVLTNYAGNQNIPSRAEGENLDALGERIELTSPAFTVLRDGKDKTVPQVAAVGRVTMWTAPGKPPGNGAWRTRQ